MPRMVPGNTCYGSGAMRCKMKCVNHHLLPPLLNVRDEATMFLPMCLSSRRFNAHVAHIAHVAHDSRGQSCKISIAKRIDILDRSSRVTVTGVVASA